MHTSPLRFAGQLVFSHQGGMLTERDGLNRIQAAWGERAREAYERLGEQVKNGLSDDVTVTVRHHQGIAEHSMSRESGGPPLKGDILTISAPGAKPVTLQRSIETSNPQASRWDEVRLRLGRLDAESFVKAVLSVAKALEQGQAPEIPQRFQPPRLEFPV